MWEGAGHRCQTQFEAQFCAYRSPRGAGCRNSRGANPLGLSPAALATQRDIDRWLVHLVGWIYHFETYQSFVFGLALIVFGAVIAATGGFRAPDRLRHGALRPLLSSSGMDHRQQRFLVRAPDPHSPRNRPDPRVDRLASHSRPPHEDRRASGDHIRRDDLVQRVDLLRQKRRSCGPPPRQVASSPADDPPDHEAWWSRQRGLLDLRRGVAGGVPTGGECGTDVSEIAASARRGLLGCAGLLGMTDSWSVRGPGGFAGP